MLLLMVLSFFAAADVDNAGARIYGDTDIFGPIDGNELALAENGELYLLNFEEKKVLRYNEDGTLQGSFGNEGEGPGEFIFPSQIWVDAEHVYVNDMGRSMIHVFDRAGSFKETLTLPSEGLRLEKVTGGWIYGQFRSMMRQATGPIEIFISNNRFEEPSKIMEMERGAEGGLRIEMTGAGVPTAKYNPVGDTPLMAVSPDGNHAYIRPAKTANIHVIDTVKKRIVHTIERSEKGVPFSEEYGTQLLQSVKEDMERQHSKVNLEPNFPEYFPAVRNLIVQENGSVMIRKWTGDPDGLEDILIVDHKGNEKALPCKANSIPRVQALRNGMAYINACNEEGEGYIIRVPKGHIDETLKSHTMDCEGSSRIMVRRR